MIYIKNTYTKQYSFINLRWIQLEFLELEMSVAKQHIGYNNNHDTILVNKTISTDFHFYIVFSLYAQMGLLLNHLSNKELVISLGTTIKWN